MGHFDMTPEETALLSRYLLAIDAAEAGPTRTDLASAPTLGHWLALVDRDGTPLLWGRVQGHPRLGNTTITTSPLIAIDAANGWARTFSRWYRLCDPFSRLGADITRSLDPSDAAVAVVHLELPGYVPLVDPELLAGLLARRIAFLRACAGEDRF